MSLSNDPIYIDKPAEKSTDRLTVPSCENCMTECINAGTALKISDVCKDYKPYTDHSLPVGEFQNYGSLIAVMQDALTQAAKGKGKERHAEEGQAFEDQLIMVIEKICPSFQLGQAIKKICESQRLPNNMAKKELLGAINYIAAKVILLDEKL